MLKKCVVAFICMVMVFSSGVTAHASPLPSEPDMELEANLVDIAPLWSNAFKVILSLDINNGRAAVSTTIIGQPGTTHITADVILERRNADGTYTHVNTWSNLTAQGDILFWGTAHFVPRGHTYRLTTNAVVHRNGFGESVSHSMSRFAN